ncbi:MAG: alpha/beta hydrolase [Acidimicrobiales bacterium]
MTDTDGIHYQTWGEGPPVLALHGLGLESSSFTGLARGVAALGLQMLAADLPGFGLTPAPEEPLTPAVLVEPVLDLAARLDAKPLVMGMSLGGRVALEAALLEPDLFRGVVMMAPPFPRRNLRQLLWGVRLLNPDVAKRIPVEWLWPLLKREADRQEAALTGDLADDWFRRASKRMIYFISCPATRWSFVSAARELVLDPAFGPDGLWTRVEQLGIPAAFVWGDKDRIVGTGNVPFVEDAVPDAFQLHVPCAGHFDNGPHFLCMEQGAIEAIKLVESAASEAAPTGVPTGPRTVECLTVSTEPHEVEMSGAGG